MPPVKIGRLAMRHEGNWWNAYYAMADSMEGAIQLGSIRMAAVINNPVRKNEFMALMQGAVSDIIEGVTGSAPVTFEITPAPESERSGHS